METGRQKCSQAGVTLLCGTATIVLAVTGCGAGGGESDAKPSPGTPAVVAPSTPVYSTASAPLPAGATDTTTTAEVLRVYDLMWAEREKAYRVASADGTDLKRYMSPDALSALETDLLRMSQEQTVMRGALRHEPVVSTLAADRWPPTATVKDCVDRARWQTLDTTTGWRIPSPADQPSRYVATARMEQGDAKRWTVTEYTMDRTRSC
ncbi:secreted protein/lipoprotein [Streptomyces sp. NPDC005752]|uniref:secreted protein/lipoprotein n=1 Tax=Streptomyces sp. NPDC005752 TaxID=3157065 RepID=UPI0033FE03A6